MASGKQFWRVSGIFLCLSVSDGDALNVAEKNSTKSRIATAVHEWTVTPMKGNPQKKFTFEDRFDRKFACWVKNNPKAWHWFKRQNRKKFRRIMKQEEYDV